MHLKSNQAAIKFIIGGLFLIIGTFSSPLLAAPDYLFLSINGDTTLSVMTQGDELGWGSNCDPGATVNWQIWFDANSNQTIDPLIDFLLMSENMTDGNLMYEESSTPDGWVIDGGLSLFGEPGYYIFKAMDIHTEESVQKVVQILAMLTPPFKITGNIVVPGVSAPDNFLANRLIMAESDSGDEGVYIGFTNNMGAYSMNVDAAASGVEMGLMVGRVDGFVTPEMTSVVISGIEVMDDFVYIVPADSVWGFVKDNSGIIIPFESDIRASSNFSEKQATTKNGRYVIYFSETEKGEWTIESDSRLSPSLLSSGWFQFSHDDVNSFQHDITYYWSDEIIYARITEQDNLPTNNYRVNAYSSSLDAWTEAVSGAGSDNVVSIMVSALDNSDWDITFNTSDDEYPTYGLIVDRGSYADVALGDTVSFNLINGKMVSGTISPDPEDGPVNWDNLYVFAGSWGAMVDWSGNYYLTTDTGIMSISVYSNNESEYLFNPAYHYLEVYNDTSGLDFTINRTHCQVSGSIIEVPLPLDGAYHQISATTITEGTDGYTAYAYIDPNDGSYSLKLCEGDWTISAPNNFSENIAPEPTMLSIAEIPDTMRSLDFTYTSPGGGCCGQYTSGYTGNANCDAAGLRDLADIVRLIDHVYLEKIELCCPETGNTNGDGESLRDLADIVRLIDHVYVSKLETETCM